MKFTKMQGCGNDYIYVDCFRETVHDPSQLAVKLSDRHFGIGGDGLILIEPSDRADAYMHMFNSDGSEGRMCGNGIRCVARYIYDHCIVGGDRCSVLIDTPSGIREIHINKKEGAFISATVDMGIAETIPDSGKTIFFNDKALIYTGIDIGNPHAVFFLDDNPGLQTSAGDTAGIKSPLDALKLEMIGPCIECSGNFPEGINSEFIEVLSRSEIRMRVWERGSGETLACGTGACASVAAGIIAGRLDAEVTVHLRGGDLEIAYDAQTGRCFMTGEAEPVFEGTVEI